MTKYEKELAGLKTWDEVQYSKPIGRGYTKIYTAGHGYMVVPRNDIFASVVENIGGAAFVGKLAYYLEEDCEAPAFCAAIK